MPKETLKVGKLKLTRLAPVETKYTYEAGESLGIRIQVQLGWKKGKAVVFVRFPKDGWTTEGVGDLPSVIESTLNQVRQGLEIEVRKAKRKLDAFNALSAEVLIAIATPKKKTG